MFEDRLKRLREARHLSQREVAEDLGIPQTTYSGYENNKREPDSTILIRNEQVDGSSPLNSSSINHIDAPFTRNCERRYFYLKLRLRHLLRQTYKKTK